MPEDSYVYKSVDVQVGLVWRLLGRLGWGMAGQTADHHYYDSETQSISNYTKLAVKRSSF